MTTRQARGLRLTAVAAAAAVVATVLPAAIVPAHAPAVASVRTAASASASAPALVPTHGRRQTCAYTNHSIATLTALGRKVGRPFDCALVYNDAAPDWASWEDPWFEHHPDPNLNWANWVAAQPGRRLIITQNMFPASVNDTAWRAKGASGRFAKHAARLARNLVRYGLGHSVIRLGHEANGTWYPDSIGDNARDYRLWAQFWRATVLAMKSVPGQHFRFDWCVNAAYRNIPLADYYPGDAVVDYVGIDAYDSGVAPGQPRWQTVYTRPGGIRDLLAFARAHHKPLTIPEWGLTASGSRLGGDVDPRYVDGIASVVRNNRVNYQSYFYKDEFASLLDRTRDLRAYRAHFGAHGDSVGTS